MIPGSPSPPINGGWPALWLTPPACRPPRAGGGPQLESRVGGKGTRRTLQDGYALTVRCRVHARAGFGLLQNGCRGRYFAAVGPGRRIAETGPMTATSLTCLGATFFGLMAATVRGKPRAHSIGGGSA
jgi:hypothetical protein